MRPGGAACGHPRGCCGHQDLKGQGRSSACGVTLTAPRSPGRTKVVERAADTRLGAGESRGDAWSPSDSRCWSPDSQHRHGGPAAAASATIRKPLSQPSSDPSPCRNLSSQVDPMRVCVSAQLSSPKGPAGCLPHEPHALPPATRQGLVWTWRPHRKERATVQGCFGSHQ